MCTWILTLLCVGLCAGKVTKYIFNPDRVPKPLINKPFVEAIKQTIRVDESADVVEDKSPFQDLGALIRANGFKEEIHKIVTQDGYKLGIYRIAGKGPIVILAHGMLDSGDAWVLMGKDSLGILLAREGYDVWLYNSRGTRYSREHLNFTARDNRYWRFSWDEMGRYDLPALLEHIVHNTSRKYVHYVGYQQGATVAFVLCSVSPGHCAAIRTFVAIAPGVYMGHVGEPLRSMSLLAAANHEFVESVSDTSTAATVRHVRSPAPLFPVVGRDRGHVAAGRWGRVLRHVPHPAASRQVLHFGQLVRTGRFAPYAPNPAEPPPPSYALSPPAATCLYYSRGDRLADLDDMLRLKADLPPLYDELVLDDYNHLDLMYAPDLALNVYDRILKVLFAREHDARNVTNATLAASLRYIVTSSTTPPVSTTTRRAEPRPTTGTATTTKKFKIPRNVDMRQMISLLKNVKVPRTTTPPPINIQREKVDFLNRLMSNNMSIKLGQNQHMSAEQNRTLKLLNDVLMDYKKWEDEKHKPKPQLTASTPQRVIIRTTRKRVIKVTTLSNNARKREKFFEQQRKLRMKTEKKRMLRMNGVLKQPTMYIPIVAGRNLEARQAMEAAKEGQISFYIQNKRNQWIEPENVRRNGYSGYCYQLVYFTR